jgi:hypothetical protein
MTKATLKPLNEQSIVITRRHVRHRPGDGAPGGAGRGLRLPDRAGRK